MKKFLMEIDEFIAMHIILDDTLHLIGGAGISAIMYLILLSLNSILNFHLVSLIVFIFILFIGIGKELIDKYIKHTEFNIRDLIATVCGGASIILYTELIYLLLAH